MIITLGLTQGLDQDGRHGGSQKWVGWIGRMGTDGWVWMCCEEFIGLPDQLDVGLRE